MVENTDSLERMARSCNAASMIDILARFAAETPSEDIPAAVRARAALILADSIGAIVGGMAEPEVIAFTARLGAGDTTIPGTPQRAAPAQAALLMGTAGTWLEMDEGNQFAKGHPGMHTIPAMLAFPPAQVSGPDFLAALTIGYEIGARVGIASALNPAMHPHGTWGTLCAAVAVQRLAGADAPRMREAITIASTLGLATSRRTMLEGGTVRNLFAGVSNQMGLTVHDMLEAGFTGSQDDLSHVYGRVVSDHFDPTAMTDALGERWEVSRNYFKLHACCRYNHAALDALAMLGPLNPAQVANVHVETYGLAAELSDPAPRNVLAAKFSVPFAIATTLLNRSSKVGSFTLDQVQREDIRALAARVTVTEDPALSAMLPDHRPARITLTMQDGTTVEAVTETNRGDWADPYGEGDIREKYDSLTARRWQDSASAHVWDAAMTLDNADTLANLQDAITAANLAIA